MPAGFLSEGDSRESTWHWTDTEPTACGKARPERATARRSEPIHGFESARQRRGGAFLEKEGLSGHFFEALPREDASAARFAPVYAKISNAFLLYME